MESPATKVRLLAQGSTTVRSVEVKSSALLEEKDLSAAGFNDLVISSDAPLDLAGDFANINVEVTAKITLQEGSINKITLAPATSGTILALAPTTTVNTFVAHSAASVTGNGVIQSAEINANGVQLASKPVQDLIIKEGVKAVVDGKEETGKEPYAPPPVSDSSSSTRHSVSAISVDNAVETMALKVNETATVTATVSPSNASNKKVTWSSSDPNVATVDANGKVTGIGGGYAIITATTVDGGFSDTKQVVVGDILIPAGFADEPGSLQGEIEKADTGSVLVVWPAAIGFTEDLEIDKPLTLLGLDTWVKGTITIKANDVKIEGFIIEAEDTTAPVIHIIDSNNVEIVNNTVIGKGYASIGTDEGPAKVTGKISGNTVTGMIILGTDGKLEVNNNVVTKTDTSTEGICFYPVGPDAVLTVKNNNIGEVNEDYAQIKINEKPASVNGKTDDLSMLSILQEDNNNATVKLTWVKTVGVEEADYTTIQSAIDAACENDTILVTAGEYKEQLVIDKPLNLLGPNTGIAGYEGRNGEAVITYPDEPKNNPGTSKEYVGLLLVEADDVIISGFTLNDGNKSDSSLKTRGVNAHGDNIKVIDNIVDGFNYVQILITSSFQNNNEWDRYSQYCKNALVQNNYTKNALDFTSIYLQGASGKVEDNVVENACRAIQIQPYGETSGGTVKNNTLSGFKTGIYYNYANKGAGKWTIKDNTIMATEVPDDVSIEKWAGIEVQTFGTEGSGDAPEVLFEGNSIDSAGVGTGVQTVGILMTEHISDVATATFNNNTFTNVDLGAQRNDGLLDLDEVLKDNEFAEGSIVIGNQIKVFIPDKNKVYNKNTGNDYTSIQTAVNEAENGDSILVGSGTYNEVVLIKKPLDLIGAGPDKTIINMSDLTEERYGIEIHSNNVKIEGFKIIGHKIFDADSAGIGHESGKRGGPQAVKNIIIRDIVVESHHDGIKFRGALSELSENILIENVKVSNCIDAGLKFYNVRDSVIRDAQSYGHLYHWNDKIRSDEGIALEVKLSDNITIEDVEVWDSQRGFLVWQGGTHLLRNVIARDMKNQFYNEEANRNADGFKFDFYDGGENDITTVRLENVVSSRNPVSGLRARNTDLTIVDGVFAKNGTGEIRSGWDSNRAISLESHTTAYIQGVTFEDNPIAIIFDSDAKVVNSEITGNIIENNVIGVQNKADVSVDATLNWWGEPSGPKHNLSNPEGQGDVVSDGVLFFPWWENAEMTVANSLANIGDIVNERTLDTYRSIQAGINAAQSGDSILVVAGTYTQDLTIDVENLTLKSTAGADATTINGHILIKSDNVTIDGFGINVIHEKTPSITLEGIKNTSIRNCKFDGGGTDKIIEENHNAIEMPSQNSANRTGVFIDNCHFSNGYYVTINGYATDIKVINSSIIDCKSGINVQGGNNLTIENTDISVAAQASENNTYCVRFASTSGQSKNMTIKDGRFVLDKSEVTEEPAAGKYHSAIIVRAGATGDLAITGATIDGEVVALSEELGLDHVLNNSNNIFVQDSMIVEFDTISKIVPVAEERSRIKGKTENTPTDLISAELITQVPGVTAEIEAGKVILKVDSNHSNFQGFVQSPNVDLGAVANYLYHAVGMDVPEGAVRARIIKNGDFDNSEIVILETYQFYEQKKIVTYYSVGYKDTETEENYAFEDPVVWSRNYVFYDRDGNIIKAYFYELHRVFVENADQNDPE